LIHGEIFLQVIVGQKTKGFVFIAIGLKKNLFGLLKQGSVLAFGLHAQAVVKIDKGIVFFLTFFFRNIGLSKCQDQTEEQQEPGDQQQPFF
jgi:hypothetical protein